MPRRSIHHAAEWVRAFAVAAGHRVAGTKAEHDHQPLTCAACLPVFVTPGRQMFALALKIKPASNARSTVSGSLEKTQLTVELQTSTAASPLITEPLAL